MRRLDLPLFVGLAALVVLVGLAGCGGDPAAACRPAGNEPFDRRSLIHVLPGAKPPTYLSDPPTSGPHQPSPPVQGVVDHPIDRPVQVGILEAGQVLLQHGDLSATDRQRLEALAGPKVVIAPNADLPDGDAVVATAWLVKQECTALDVRALRRFVADHAGKAPGSDG